ncbi:hypothetical protein B0T17DRAFT_309537 [Bombardia bombarda]|uniref:Uncharacterized protein n=1 Tax=Bombardia bombarda TaxID=252184 RepID=A0AA39WUV3_9PEZI|nr:hypothetical protein B0T17DRAFT_309537 [Bombardia bombarda]
MKKDISGSYAEYISSHCGDMADEKAIIVWRSTHESNVLERYISIHEMLTGAVYRSPTLPAADRCIISPDCTLLALGVPERIIIAIIEVDSSTNSVVLDEKTWRQLKLKHSSLITCMEFSPDRTQLVVGFHSGKIEMWEF